MPSPDQERWLRVKERLRAEVGEEIYQSWFASMELDRDRRAGGASDRAHALPQELDPDALCREAARLLAGRSLDVREDRRQRAQRVIRTAPPKPRPPESVESARDPRIGRMDIGELRAAYAPVSSGHDALGGSPLDLRLTFDSFVVGRSNTLAHAAAKQVAVGAPRRAGHVQPALHPCRRRPRQDPPAAGHHLGRQPRRERKVLYLTAEKFMYGFVSALRNADRAGLQGSAARHRRAGDRRSAVPAGQVDAGRVLPHAQCPDRCRPAGRDRRRPAADRSGKPRRPRALAARRRAGGGDGPARRGIAARNSENPVTAARQHHPGFDVPARCWPTSPRP
jgi:chromosomal replication initiator protein